jgi:hypothetical protein
MALKQQRTKKKEKNKDKETAQSKIVDLQLVMLQHI